MRISFRGQLDLADFRDAIARLLDNFHESGVQQVDGVNLYLWPRQGGRSFAFRDGSGATIEHLDFLARRYRENADITRPISTDEERKQNPRGKASRSRHKQTGPIVLIASQEMLRAREQLESLVDKWILSEEKASLLIGAKPGRACRLLSNSSTKFKLSEISRLKHLTEIHGMAADMMPNTEVAAWIRSSQTTLADFEGDFLLNQLLNGGDRAIARLRAALRVAVAHASVGGAVAMDVAFDRVLNLKLTDGPS